MKINMGYVGYNTNKKPLYIALLLLVLLVVSDFIAILVLNSGYFTFALDDPYIHIALSQNIVNGHYGVNNNEFSSPSSSILWPFIIAMFSKFENINIMILIINALLSMASICIYWKCLLPKEQSCITRKESIVLAITLSVIILTSNTIGLVFTGMEHSAQVLLTLIIIFGLIKEIETKKIYWWLLISIILAPLIRYECLAISIPALLFVFVRGHRRKSVFSFILLLALSALFSIFLKSMNLDFLPNSILAKSPTLLSESKIIPSILVNIETSVSSSRGFVLIFGLALLIRYALKNTFKTENRQLAGTISLSIVFHLLFGKYGWFGRYEAYIFSALIITMLYLYKDLLYNYSKKDLFRRLHSFIVFAFVISSMNNCLIIFLTPVASNNIYEQQYQMHRFVTEFYDKPVAVNDLGLVSYNNNNYVLDLWGLASAEALAHRINGANNNWIKEISDKNSIKLAMIYKSWFENIPESWQIIGELRLGKIRISPADSVVTFYLLDCSHYEYIYHLLEDFRATLPQGVVFDLNREKDNKCENSDSYLSGT